MGVRGGVGVCGGGNLGRIECRRQRQYCNSSFDLSIKHPHITHPSHPSRTPLNRREPANLHTIAMRQAHTSRTYISYESYAPWEVYGPYGWL